MLVPIARIKAGMQVAQDVVNANGMVLLPAGATLSPEIIGRLESWGLDNVDVAGDIAGDNSIDADLVLTPELLGAAEELVHRKFKHVTTSNPTVASIRALAVKRTAAGLLKNNPEHSAQHE